MVHSTLEARKRMLQGGTPGQIVILNGTPRSGKSSIATVIQNTFEGVWMNLGVDRFKPMAPERYQPGIGLRPGGERPDLEPLIVVLYRATDAASFEFPLDLLLRTPVTLIRQVLPGMLERGDGAVLFGLPV